MSLAFSVLYSFGPRATLSSFMPARQGIFVRDTLSLVLGKCCKVLVWQSKLGYILQSEI